MSYRKVRRAKRSAADRLRPFWIPIALGVATIVAVAAVALTWPGFEVRTVAVTGNAHVSTNEILRRAAIAPGRSIWLENTGAIANRIRAIPNIASVRIYRIPPASLRIAVRERVPFAVVQSGDDAGVVDSMMHVLADSPGTSQLPVFVVRSGIALTPGRSIASKETVALRNAYQTMTGKGLTPQTLAMDRYDEVVATLPGGLRLELGDPDNLDQRIGLLKAIITQVVRGQRRVSSIDVRAPSTPVIEYH